MRVGEFYPGVPKRLEENIFFRHKLVLEGTRDPAKGRELWNACQADVLFFFNAFLWTYNPKKRGQKVLPFVTWDFQDAAILEVKRAIHSGLDLTVEKSRDMGATWIVLGCFLHEWNFFDYVSLLAGSRDQEYVDKAGNPKALFQKLDFAIERLPRFLLRGVDLTSDAHRTKNHLFHPATNSVIDGEATTEDFGRGDRRTAIFLDEFAMCKGGLGFEILSSVHDVSDCIIAGSTHKGVDRAFYHETRRPDDGVIHLRLHWSEHPEKAQGLYRDAEGRPRSPWYDKECKRRPKAEVAQELDIDPRGAGGQFFDATTIRQLMAKTRLPSHIGELNYSPGSFEPRSFTDAPEGRMRIWFRLVPDAPLAVPPHRYVIGADISAGMGASNSVLAVWDRLTQDRVAEFVTARMKPEDLAEVAMAVGKMFGYGGSRAFLVIERNGPGEAFVKRIVDLGYGTESLYFDRTNEGKLSEKVSDRPGWHATPEKKATLFTDYRMLLFAGDCRNLSIEALDECGSIVFGNDGNPVHLAHRSTIEDNSDARANHADRVTADALAARILSQSSKEEPEEDSKVVPEDKIPEQSFAWRRRQSKLATGGRSWSWRT